MWHIRSDSFKRIPQGWIDTYPGHADSSHRTREILYDAEVIADTLQSNGKILLDLCVPSSLVRQEGHCQIHRCATHSNAFPDHVVSVSLQLDLQLDLLRLIPRSHLIHPFWIQLCNH